MQRPVWLNKRGSLGAELILATTLLERGCVHQSRSRDAFYRARWQAEVVCGSLKETMAMRVVVAL